VGVEFGLCVVLGTIEYVEAVHADFFFFFETKSILGDPELCVTYTSRWAFVVSKRANLLCDTSIFVNSFQCGFRGT
jgi:hypothetical protein